MRRSISVAVSLLTLAGLAFGAAISSAQTTGPSLNLTAGQGKGIVSMNGFVGDPGLGGHTARVAVGTTVNWQLGSDEPHTVTFLAGTPRPQFIVPQPESPDLPPMINPAFFFPTPPTGPYDGRSYINSGFLEPDASRFSVTFSTAGSFGYVCLIHPEMTATIEVVAPGTAGITTQAAVDQLAATHMGAVHEAQVTAILATRQSPRPVDSANGGQTQFVRAGTDWRGGHLDVLAFLPGDLTINAGDTVVWYIDHRIPHSVTFAQEGMPPPPPFAPSPQPSGPPRLVLAEGARMARPSAVYDPGMFFNSGIFGDIANQTLGGAGAWSLTFDQPGTYEYFCYLHEALGMKGKIIVE